MAIICAVDYNTASMYKGASLSAKYRDKKHKVYLRLVCDDLTLMDSIGLARVSSNVLMVDYQGLETNPLYLGLGQSDVYVGRVVDFGNNITEEDIERVEKGTPSGVVPVINLPSDYKDLHFLWEVSKKYNRVRFSGGTLFSVQGVKLGAVGVDILDKAGVKYEMDAYRLGGTLDVLENVDISTLTIDTSVKQGKVSKPKAKAKKSVSFEGLLKSNGWNGGF